MGPGAVKRHECLRHFDHFLLLSTRERRGFGKSFTKLAAGKRCSSRVWGSQQFLDRYWSW